MDDFYLVLGDRFVNARMYMGGRRAGSRTAAALASMCKVDQRFKVDKRDKAKLEKMLNRLGQVRISLGLFSRQRICSGSSLVLGRRGLVQIHGERQDDGDASSRFVSALSFACRVSGGLVLVLAGTRD